MKPVVLRADARRLPLPDASVDLIVTSPPYFGLRSYTDGGEHYAGQIGSEATPAEWLAAMVECTAEWVRVLKPSGSIFVNLGDKYSGYFGPNWKHDRNPGGGERKPRGYRDDMPVSAPSVWGIPNKSLMGLPWRYALACTDQLGLILRRDIIWSKPNGLPESVTDRCRSSHEYVFHLVRQPRYYAAVDEIREPHLSVVTFGRRHAGAAFGADKGGRGGDGSGHTDGNPLGKLPGSVWDIPSQPLNVPPGLGVDHFAAFPMELPRRIILGWSPPGVCCECGEGRRPVTSASRETFYGNGRHRSGAQQVKDGAATVGWAHDEKWRTSTTITGYACACPEPTAATRPAIVLDPFGGTGTTALVAAMHGRVGISVDRSADYCRLAAWRTTDPAQRAAALGVPKPPPVPAAQEALFPP